MTRTAPATAPTSRLRAVDLLPTASIGLRTRRLRAALSALGVAIGIAAVVAVLGVTTSSESDLLARIDRLGTNLLTVVNGHTLGGAEAELPAAAPAMLARADGVQALAPTAELPDARVYRTDAIPAYHTNALAVRAADPSLLPTLDAHLQGGEFLDNATAPYPVTVLGYQAARALGITAPGTAQAPVRIWLTVGGGGHWFTVIGILEPLELAPEIDNSALTGFGAATGLLGYDGHPSRIYVRAATDRVTATANRLARSADPENPQQVLVSRPSDALTARIAVQSSGTALFLGLSAIALLVGGIGIANTMVISVLERRGEIGLRRALGAGRRHIAAQFLTEALILSLLGGAAGVAIGTAATTVIARLHNWTLHIPQTGVWGGLGAALAVGAIAGIYPALRAARLTPSEALRSG